MKKESTKKAPVEKPLDPKTIEIVIKLAEVGKITFLIETKKDVSKLVKKAVDAGIKYVSKKLEELDQ